MRIGAIVSAVIVVLVVNSGCTDSDTAGDENSKSSNGVEEMASEFGFGRVPLGDVRLCPSGDLSASEVSQADVHTAVADVLRGAAADEGAGVVWASMDETLRSAHGSFESFEQRFDSVELDAVYEEWRFSDQVQAQGSVRSSEALVDVGAVCGDEVREATWMGSGYFPDFEGVSGGAVQLFFLNRPGGLRLWFSY